MRPFSFPYWEYRTARDKEISVFTAVQYPRTGGMHSQPGRKAS